ncbi:MAG TPA: ABC transporter substrate-binding protein [Chloroflexota bacterium]|nr:ABC transporter substrate-binding protein [Chloroflexota bacterium]
MTNRAISRRRALAFGLAGLGGAVLAACGQAAAPTAAPTAAPAKPTEAPKPAGAAPTTAAAAPTAGAGVGGATPAAGATAAPAKPAEAAKPSGAPPTPAPTPTLPPEATGPVGQSGAKTTLTLWHTLGGGPDLKAFRELLTKYTTEHPDVAFKLSFVPGSSETGPYVQKITAAIAGGSPPDIFHMNRPAQFGAAGALYELSDFIRTMPQFDPKDFFPAAWTRNTWLDKVYGVPVIVDSRGYWINKALFKQAGLDPDKPPATWDDLLKVNEALTVKEGSAFKRVGFMPLFGNVQFYSYLYLNGGELLDESYKVQFNSDKGVQVLDWLIKATDAIGGAQIVNTFQQSFSTGANDPFIGGLVASKIDGCWNLATVAQYAPNLEFAVALEPIPPGGHKATMVGGYNWSIARDSKQPRPAFDFLAWFSLPAQSTVFAQASQNMPARKSALDSTYIQKNPNIKFFFDALSYGVPYTTAPWSQVMFDNVNATATQEALYKRKSPKQALDDAAKVVQAEVDKWVKK